MKPVLVLVGRPNVGKSTLFNRLTKSRSALVGDLSGITRDRQYGYGSIDDEEFILIDTGGMLFHTEEDLQYKIFSQIKQAIIESDIVIFLVDGRTLITKQDYEIAKFLRPFSKHVVLAVNKTEGNLDTLLIQSEFYRLGLGYPYLISAEHGSGIIELITSSFLLVDKISKTYDVPQLENQKAIKLAVVGRPNVGKSTLINKILGEDRMVVSDVPGTTRDAVRNDFDYMGKSYTLIDTAGIRKRAKVVNTIEKFSIIKTLKSIEEAHVIIFVLNAQEGILEQDVHIASFISEAGRSAVALFNKVDLIDQYQRKLLACSIQRKLHFFPFDEVHYLSAIRRCNLIKVFQSVDKVYDSAFLNMKTSNLTLVLQELTKQLLPPRQGSFRPKLRYAHQGGRNPPVVIIHGSKGISYLPKNYIKYLEAGFRKAFPIFGTPLKIVLKN